MLAKDICNEIMLIFFSIPKVEKKILRSFIYVSNIESIKRAEWLWTYLDSIDLPHQKSSI